MKGVAGDVEAGHLQVGHLDPFGIGPRVEFAPHGQTGCGRRGGNQFHDGRLAGERLAAPGLGDVQGCSTLFWSVLLGPFCHTSEAMRGV